MSKAFFKTLLLINKQTNKQRYEIKFKKFYIEEMK